MNAEEVGEFLSVERQDYFLLPHFRLHPPEIRHQPVADRPAGEDGLRPPGDEQVVGHHPKEVDEITDSSTPLNMGRSQIFSQGILPRTI